MILSAVKRTSARLKFWFIKNYMSPQVRAVGGSGGWCPLIDDDAIGNDFNSPHDG